MADCRTPSLPDLPAGYRWFINKSYNRIEAQEQYKSIFGRMKWREVVSEYIPSQYYGHSYIEMVEHSATIAFDNLEYELCKRSTIKETNGA